MKIYLDGLERSGNVYLSYALGWATGLEVNAKRTHRVETLKEYNQDYPFVVPVRDALPSIASAKIYRDKVFSDNLYGVEESLTKEFEEIIKRYAEYIQYLVDNPKFFIAPFHEFTKDHNKVIYSLSKKYPSITIETNVSAKDIIELASAETKNVFDTELGNLPRPTPKKEEIEEILKTKYLKEINDIQSNIDILYKRYYEIIPITDIWYNKSMTDIVVEKTRKVCCDGCTCETSHSAEPVKE
jgi:hypothetical protein